MFDSFDSNMLTRAETFLGVPELKDELEQMTIERDALLKRLEAAEGLAEALDYFVRVYDRCSKGRTDSPPSSAVWADCEEKSVNVLAAWHAANELHTKGG